MTRLEPRTLFIAAEVDHLYQEATMPLEEVVAKYGRGEDEQGDDDEATSEVKGESSAPKTLKNPLIAELSKSKKPISPFLRAKTLSRVP